jgi:tRNA (mo5U34)-methyltransferase
MDNEVLLDKVNTIEWMHTIELGNGVVTRGKWPANPHIQAAFDQIDFTGKKVLDVGTCNGLWTFEAEKRGAAEVHSIDYLTHVGYWCSPGYQLAHQALESKAIYNPDLSVYDVEQLGSRDFDVVIFSGVYYHLKSPLLALSKLRSIMKTGGLLVVDGPILLDPGRSYATFLYRDAVPDRSNWWIPTARCLTEWIECSRFEILQEFPDPDPVDTDHIGFRAKTAIKRLLGWQSVLSKRTVMIGRTVAGPDPLYSSPDPDLLPFISQPKGDNQNTHP